MIPKLSTTWYAIRSVVHISNINTPKSIYYAYFHSVIKYWIIWGAGVGFFQQWEDFHFTEENCQNYHWCTTQNLLWSLFKQFRGTACSISLYTFSNELRYQ